MIGKLLGDYTIIELLGRGGMARVYRGYDEKLNRYAAVKVIDTEIDNEELRQEYQERFTREARAIARLQHPNIVGVYQFDQLWDLNFMAMQFIEGEDLRYILKDLHEAGKRLPLPTVLNIMRGIASALDYAHSMGVIHRDIKPSNIMVTPEGRAVLTDFGLVLNVADGTIGNTFGSAHYIAPEQAVSSAQSVPQSDFYSLGVVLFEMVTGQVPFDDPSTMSVALKHLNEPPPAPSTINPAVSPAVEDVVMRLLRKQPNERYPNGAAFIAAFEAAVEASAPPDEDDTIELDERQSVAAPPQPDQPEKTANLPATDRERQTHVLPGPKHADNVTTAIDPPARQSGGGRRWLFLLLLLIVLGGAAVLVWQGIIPIPGLSSAATTGTPTGAAPTATTPAEEAAAVVASPTTVSAAIEPSATEPPTATDEPTATDMPTVTDVPTDTPTATATTTPTEPPTATSAPSATPQPSAAAVSAGEDATAGEPGEIALYYDANALLIVNRAPYDIDVDPVEMRYDPGDGSPVLDFSVSDLRGGLAPTDALPPDHCFHIWRMGLNTAAADMPYLDHCGTRAAWRAVSPIHYFWVSSDPDATFDVVLFGDVLATCAIAAGECEFVIP
jgi:serine/threonine protein kinase